MDISCRRIFGKGSIDWKFEGLVTFLIVKSDWMVRSPPTVHPIPKHIQSKFWDSHFVQRSWKVCKFCLWGWQPPTALHARVVSYTPRAFEFFYGKGGRTSSGMGSRLEIRFSGSLFMSQSDQKASTPSMSYFPQMHQKESKDHLVRLFGLTESRRVWG